jgi:hypothetical protein
VNADVVKDLATAEPHTETVDGQDLRRGGLRGFGHRGPSFSVEVLSVTAVSIACSSAIIHDW